MTSTKKIFSKIVGWFGYKLFNKNYVKNLKSLSKYSKLNLDYILEQLIKSDISHLGDKWRYFAYFPAR